MTTPFQFRCSSELSRLLRAGDQPFTMKQVEGEDETYFVFEVIESSPRVVVYVYEDEAGFFVGKKWHIWEQPDYPTSADLMGAFLTGLRSALDLAGRPASEVPPSS